MIESMRCIVLMMEAVSGPVIVKAKSIRTLGNERVLRIIMVAQFIGIQMPLADVGSFITAFGQHMADAALIGVHADFIDDHAGRRGVLAGEQRSTVRCAHRMAGNSLTEVHAISMEGVNIGRLSVLVAGIAAGSAPELIGKNVEQIRSLCHCNVSFLQKDVTYKFDERPANPAIFGAHKQKPDKPKLARKREFF